jgi:hypothetical protein
MFVAINTNKSNRVMALRAMMGFNNGGRPYDEAARDCTRLSSGIGAGVTSFVVWTDILRMRQ